MNKSKVLVSLVIVIYVLFTVFGFLGNETIAFTLDSLILPLVTVIYFLFFNKKTLFFSLFILCYAASDIIGLIVNFIPYDNSYSVIYKLDYYIGNTLYILSYAFLFIGICKKIDMLHILKNFKIHLIVLTALNIYLVYVLQVIVDPELELMGEYYLELVYNIIMLLLLSAALLNFFYRDNKKALYLFLGALCIVFAEVIDVAYIYISQKNLLNFFSTTLSLSAFYFFCKQMSFSDVREEEIQIAID
ncbi:hypothetical protein N1F78_15810 [Seonamhaeicola sp. MEBiC1930]|uniref:hypothetical protein n=1 Tax=Seonamhaeicola sp. MEBiC01930 TaxID=2976768 RepID=UPI003252A7E7